MITGNPAIVSFFTIFTSIMRNEGINIPNLKYGESGNFLLIAGPCVVENEKVVFETASHLKQLSDRYSIPFIFKMY